MPQLKEPLAVPGGTLAEDNCYGQTWEPFELHHPPPISSSPSPVVVKFIRKMQLESFHCLLQILLFPS